MEKDPLEIKNLYDVPEYRDEVKKMTVAISAWKGPKSETYLDEDAPQIKQPNVPHHNLSHRKAVIDYYRQKMRTTQFIL